MNQNRHTSTTIVIIPRFVHGCKNIVEVLGDGIVSVTRMGSDGDAIFLAKSGPILIKNSLNLDAIKKGSFTIMP